MATPSRHSKRVKAEAIGRIKGMASALVALASAFESKRVSRHLQATAVARTSALQRDLAVAADAASVTFCNCYSPPP
jgi:hypothetical protein